MPVARLRIRVIAVGEREDEEGGRRVEESTRGFDIAIGRFSRLLGGRSRGLRLWQKIAIVTAPALFTLGKHLLGLAGGLATMAVVVGAAAAPWAGLAYTAAVNAEKMGRAGERFRRGTSAVGKAWMDLARATAPETLGPVTDVLNGIAAAIPKLEPLVREISPDMARMGRDIKAWLSGRGFERFLQNIQDYGVPAFRNLVAAGKDFMATVGIGFRQFLPLAGDIARTLRNGAADMRRAARQGGIANWMRDWRNNSQVANRFLREAARTVGIMGKLLSDVGPGQLSAVSAGLTALNAVNPHTLMAIVLAWAAGKGIVGLVAALRMLQALRALRAISFLPTAGQISAAAAALSAAAAVLQGMAAAINGLARQVASFGLRTRVNTSALDQLKAIWDSTPKNATATFSISTLDGVRVAMMAIGSTMAAIVSNLSTPAQFTARADTGVALGVFAAWLVSWIAVRAVGLALVTFTAIAINLASAPSNLIVGSWVRVRAMSAGTVVFGVTATAGNVTAAANAIIAAWGRVRAAAAVRPRFTATAINTVSAGAAMIVAAWMRVRAMPKTWQAVGIVSPGNVPGASARIVSSWRRIYGLARSWHGVAICSFSGGFGGISGPGGGGGGGGWYNPGNLFVTFPPLPFTGRPYNPYVGTPGGGLGEGDVPPVGVGGNIDMSDYFGNEGGKFSEPNGQDFLGGFARGGPIGTRGYSKPSVVKNRGGGVRHVKIYDDVWIRSEQDLIDILTNA